MSEFYNTHIFNSYLAIGYESGGKRRFLNQGQKATELSIWRANKASNRGGVGE